MIPTTPEILCALPWIVFALLVPILLRRRVSIAAHEAPSITEAPLVSIIVPARNEAENITMCLSTLLATTYMRWEIIVVDDDSVDGTADIVRAIAERSGGNVRLLHGEPLPDGWLGKSWACWQGYQAARGDLLLFTDADTRHHPPLLGHAVGALRDAKADLVTVLPRQLMLGFWERVVLPQVFVAIMLRFHDLRRISRARSPRDAIANGQFMLFSRDGYVKVGGHEAVRDNVAEDLRLAQRVVEVKGRIFAAHAEDLMETRMYRNLRGIIEGWTKNLAIGSRQSVPAWIAPVLPWLIGLLGLLFWVAPPAILTAGLFAPVSRFVLEWALTATVVSLGFWAVAHALFRIPMTHAVLYPVGATITAFLFFRSAARGNVVAWRGREYGRPSRGA